MYLNMHLPFVPFIFSVFQLFISLVFHFCCIMYLQKGGRAWIGRVRQSISNVLLGVHDVEVFIDTPFYAIF